jgi:hypothetical protein
MPRAMPGISCAGPRQAYAGHELRGSMRDFRTFTPKQSHWRFGCAAGSIGKISSP